MSDLIASAWATGIIRTTGEERAYRAGFSAGAAAEARDRAIAALPASPADPPSEPDGKSTANDAKVSRPADPASEPEWVALANDIRIVDGNHDMGASALADALTRRGWTRRRPADPDMEERLRDELRAIEEARPPGSYPHLGSETDIARLAARLAQGRRP